MKDFGKGWMSSNAADLCKIMFTFGNVHPMDLIMELGRIEHPGVKTINVRSIENALARLRVRL